MTGFVTHIVLTQSDKKLYQTVSEKTELRRSNSVPVNQ